MIKYYKYKVDCLDLHTVQRRKIICLLRYIYALRFKNEKQRKKCSSKKTRN